MLLKEIEDLPPILLKGSHSELGTLEVRWLCATKKLKLKKNDSVRLMLFSDSTILICKKNHTFGESTWLGKTAVTKTMLGTKKHNYSYKFTMALQAEQFRSVNFIYSSHLKGKTYELELTSICCWEIRHELGDSTWCVGVKRPLMEEFVKLLEQLIKKNSNGRTLHFDRQMRFVDVPYECGSVVRKELKKCGFKPSHDHDGKNEE